jgi:hypothetical protein
MWYAASPDTLLLLEYTVRDTKPEATWPPPPPLLGVEIEGEGTGAGRAGAGGGV